jgi:hypothetical protein
VIVGDAKKEQSPGLVFLLLGETSDLLCAVEYFKEPWVVSQWLSLNRKDGGGVLLVVSGENHMEEEARFVFCGSGMINPTISYCFARRKFVRRRTCGRRTNPISEKGGAACGCSPM